MGKTDKLNEAFIAAVSSGDIKEAEALFSKGASIDKKIDGMTPLHYVVAARSSMRGFRWLIDKGANLNERDDNDLTPLMTVCGCAGKTATEMALGLIGAGCDVTYRRDDGMSALEFAAKSADPKVIRELVKRGVPVDGQGKNLFPSLLACRAGNLANLKVLVELGCDLAKRTQLPWAKGFTCLGVARLEKKRSIVKYLEQLNAPE